MVLAAIAVDSSIAFLGQREVANAVAAAANDAASQGVSNGTFYERNRVELDSGTVQQLAVDRVIAVLDPARFHDVAVQVDVVPATAPACPPGVRVRASARVSYFFARALPGGPDEARVTATSVASPQEAAQGGC
jgi:Flp pilus assembly protein TadG